MKLSHLFHWEKLVSWTLIVSFVIFTENLTLAQSLSQNYLPIGEPSSDREIDKIKIKNIRVIGNTVLVTEIAEFVNKLLGKELDPEQVSKISDDITKLYRERGFITSGAVISRTDLERGFIEIKVIEGRLEELIISGLKRLREGYIRERILDRVSSPLNFQQLEESRILLERDPLFDSVKFSLARGGISESTNLTVLVEEAQIIRPKFVIANDQSPNIGEWQGRFGLSHLNLLGVGDKIEAEYGRNVEADTYKLSYFVPINDRDGTWEFTLSRGFSSVVLPSLREIDLRIESDIFRSRIRQPIIKNVRREVAVAGEFYIGNSQNFVLDDISVGEANFLALRLSQEWIENIPAMTALLLVQSELSFGLAKSDNPLSEIDSDFALLRVQSQFIKEMGDNNEFLTNIRLIGQYSPNFLLTIEKLSLGGVNIGRGYPKDTLFGDSAIFATLELRYRVFQDEDWGEIYIVGFTDVGAVWNQGDTGDSNAIASIGTGVTWEVQERVNLELFWGIPLINIEQPTDSLSGNGIHTKIGLSYQF